MTKYQESESSVNLPVPPAIAWKALIAELRLTDGLLNLSPEGDPYGAPASPDPLQPGMRLEMNVPGPGPNRPARLEEWEPSAHRLTIAVLERGNAASEPQKRYRFSVCPNGAGRAEIRLHVDFYSATPLRHKFGEVFLRITDGKANFAEMILGKLHLYDRAKRVT